MVYEVMKLKKMKYIEYISNNMVDDTLIIEDDVKCIIAPYLDIDHMFYRAHSLNELKELNMDDQSFWLYHRISHYMYTNYGVDDVEVFKKSFEVYRNKMVRLLEEKNLSKN